MWKKILFLDVLSSALAACLHEDSNSMTWTPGSKIPTDGITARIGHGDNFVATGSVILSPIIKRGTRDS